MKWANCADVKSPARRFSPSGRLASVSAAFLWCAAVLSDRGLDRPSSAEGYALGAWSAVWYPILYACCNVLLLPGGLLSIGGGFFFGLWWGFLIVLVGNVTGAAIAFYLSRKVGRSWLRRKLLRNPTLGALEPAVAREGWKIILLSQLHPLFPTSLLNYLYGLTTIRFRTCILWVAIGQAQAFSLHLHRHAWAAWTESDARQEPSEGDRILGMGRRFADFSALILVVLGRISLRLLQEARKKSLSGTREVATAARGRSHLSQESMGTKIDLDFLAAQAWRARENAYARYSHFAVGAALATSSGEIFAGCNVENVSFGLTICAERVAVSSAIAAGHREFDAIAVAAETEDPVVPCGACRQFLAEFNPSMRVYCIGRGGGSRTILLSDLLPSPFSSFSGP